MLLAYILWNGQTVGEVQDTSEGAIAVTVPKGEVIAEVFAIGRFAIGTNSTYALYQALEVLGFEVKPVHP